MERVAFIEAAVLRPPHAAAGLQHDRIERGG
jgi:hypothetical protein